MSRIDEQGLKLVGKGDVLPSVEVDTANDNHTFFSCETAIAAILGTLPESRRVTIYVYETPSINFGRQTNSIYFVVGGSERVVESLHAALKTVPGADVRYGEYLSPQSCVPRFHYENGVVWRPAEEGEWESIGSIDRNA